MSDKHTYRAENVKKTINTRLNRIEGQIHGIKRMVAEDKYCDDVLIQFETLGFKVK